ncbi:MAG: metal-dependent hydrolase [Peptostreptococcaceae bacterium]
MVKETHTKGSYIFSLLALPFVLDRYLYNYEFIYKIILIFVYVYFSYIGSLSPDIDMKNSYISKVCPLFYKFFGSKLRHRGLTHSLLFLYILGYILNLLIIYTENNIVFVLLSSGFFIGYVSHLVLDLITKEGIEIFYPVTLNFSLLPIKTSSKTEKNLCKLLHFIYIFLLGYRFYILI